MSNFHDERSPLLQSRHEYGSGHQTEIKFSEDDPEHPRAWPRRRKLANIAVVSSMAILSPLASSMFTPGIGQIAEGLHTSTDIVVGATTGFVVMLGIGPLIMAPLSETFGRRKLYLYCFAVFTLVQVLTAFSPNVTIMILLRIAAGFFGSVAIANGGGTISDMFCPEERASVFGWYLLGPQLGPTLGPLLGGIVVQRLGWRWVFFVLAIVCGINTTSGFLFLRETYVPVLLREKKLAMEEESSSIDTKYWFEGEDDRPLFSKLCRSLSRPIRILSHPAVLVMSLYQALVFSATYSLYTNYHDIYGRQYGFNTEQVGFMYLGMGLGFAFAVRLLVPRIDDVYKALKARNDGVAKPEYRLPLANIGFVLIPLSLFWFAWTVHFHAHWLITITSTVFYGIGQVIVINCAQNYYIDAFETYAASAIAAGTFFRSIFGGVVPLFAPPLFRSVGYGWGISVFGLIALLLLPIPLLFYRFGERIRVAFTVDL